MQYCKEAYFEWYRSFSSYVWTVVTRRVLVSLITTWWSKPKSVKMHEAYSGYGTRSEGGIQASNWVFFEAFGNCACKIRSRGGGRKLCKHGHLKRSELFFWIIINQACAYALDGNAAMSSKMFERNKALIVSKVCNPLLASNHSFGVRQSSRTGKACACLLCVCFRARIDMPNTTEKATIMSKHQ